MKKQYIIPEMTAQKVNFQMSICVNSVQSNVGMEFIGNTDENPI